MIILRFWNMHTFPSSMVLVRWVIWGGHNFISIGPQKVIIWPCLHIWLNYEYFSFALSYVVFFCFFVMQSSYNVEMPCYYKYSLNDSNFRYNSIQIFIAKHFYKFKYGYTMKYVLSELSWGEMFEDIRGYKLKMDR